MVLVLMWSSVRMHTVHFGHGRDQRVNYHLSDRHRVEREIVFESCAMVISRTHYTCVYITCTLYTVQT